MKFCIPNYLPLFIGETREIYLKENQNIHYRIFKEIRERYSVEELADKLGLSQRSVYYYLSGKRTPSLQVIDSIIKMLPERKYLEELYLKFDRIYTWGHSSDYLPKYFSRDLAYVSGLICGDGHISKRTEVYLWNDSKHLLEITSKVIKRLFKHSTKYRDLGTHGKIEIGSRPINIFFNRVIGIPKGKKKGLLTIPKFVYLHETFKKNFIRGIFDSDGGVTLSKAKYSILISSSTHKFLKELQNILRDLGIDLPGPYQSGNRQGFEIRSFSKKETQKFAKVIGSFHPKKKKRLDALVAQSG